MIMHNLLEMRGLSKKLLRETHMLTRSIVCGREMGERRDGVAQSKELAHNWLVGGGHLSYHLADVSTPVQVSK